MGKRTLRHKLLDDSDHNAKTLTEYEHFHRGHVTKSNEYLLSVGLTNRQVVNPLSSILFV
jgi:hypothetical protein